MFALSGKLPLSMLSSPYIRLVYLPRIRPKSFTRMDICGMNGVVTGARILLSLSPLPLIRAPALITQTLP
jgi:hypothetical protein